MTPTLTQTLTPTLTLTLTLGGASRLLKRVEALYVAAGVVNMDGCVGGLRVEGWGSRVEG